MRLEQSFLTSHQYHRTSAFTSDKTKFEASVKDVRDKLRAKFETNTAGATADKQIYVSSIAKWTGIALDYIGYGFVVKIGNHQWLFMFFGNPSTTGFFSYFFQSSAVGTYFRNYGDTSGSTPEPSQNTSGYGNCAIHYNSESGFYNMGFTDTATMRKTSGGVEQDFFEPAQSPYSAAANFMPAQGSGKIKGVLFTETSTPKVSIVVDNEKPFLMAYFGNSSYMNSGPDYSWMFGKVVVPTETGDTDGYASFGFRNQVSSPSGAGLTVYHPATGSPTGYDISYDNSYDIINMWTTDVTPKLNFKSVQVVKSGLPQKGFIDTDVVRVAGPNTYGASIVGNLIMNTPTGPLTCLCGDLFTPWGSVSLSERYGYFVDYPIL